MLVLARQLNERIVMPTVPATIEVVAIKPHGVRLGIEAAEEVLILREEVLRRGGVPAHDLLPRPRKDAEASLHRLQRILRNRLQTLALGLDLIHEQMGQGDPAELQAMLRRMQGEVCRLDEQLRGVLSDALAQSNQEQDVFPCAAVETEVEFSI